MKEDYLKEIVDSYHFAKEKGFDSIVIAIDTDEEKYSIAEHEGGFISDLFDCVYSDIEEIAEDLLAKIKGKVEEINIE